MRPEYVRYSRALINCAFTRTRLPRLHAAFEQVRHAKLLSDFAQVALRARLVLHHEVRLITFRSAISGEISQNLVLHAISEVGVLFFVAQIFERQNGDAFFRNGSWCW